MPRFIVVAGPNGAGKSEYSRAAYADAGIPIVDADAIERKESISNADAWVKARDTVVRHLDAYQDVVIESTLAGHDRRVLSTYIQLMERARKAGYDVLLVFIALGSADAHMARVDQRKEAGGHAIADDTVARRYEWSIDQRLGEAFDRASRTLILDNSDNVEPFRPVLYVVGQQHLQYIAEDVPAWVTRGLGERDDKLIAQDLQRLSDAWSTSEARVEAVSNGTVIGLVADVTAAHLAIKLTAKPFGTETSLERGDVALVYCRATEPAWLTEPVRLDLPANRLDLPRKGINPFRP